MPADQYHFPTEWVTKWVTECCGGGACKLIKWISRKRAECTGANNEHWYETKVRPDIDHFYPIESEYAKQMTEWLRDWLLTCEPMNGAFRCMEWAQTFITNREYTKCIANPAKLTDDSPCPFLNVFPNHWLEKKRKPYDYSYQPAESVQWITYSVEHVVYINFIGAFI